MPTQYEVDLRSAKQFAGQGNGFPFGMLVASIIVIVAAAIECSDGNDACDQNGELFALIGGIVLFVFDMLYMCLLYNDSLGPTLNTVWIFIFWILWGVLAGYTTFEDPFRIPGNGYFAAWLGFFAATGLLVYNVAQAHRLKDRFVNQGLPLCFIIVGSIVVILAGIANGNNNIDNEEILAIIAGTVSLFVAILRILLGDKVDPGFFAVFMLGWWLILGLILTFGVFEQIGNGFLATWVCLASSIYLCFPHDW